MNSIDQLSIGNPFNITTSKPMYLGGTPMELRNGQHNKYKGCIRNVKIVDHLLETKTFTKFSTQFIYGNVSLSACPTT